MCQVLSVSRSSYYQWLHRPESNRRKKDKKLIKEIKRIHKECYQTYGSRRMKAQLNIDGFSCSKDRVRRLMNENGIFSKLRRKYKATTQSNHNYPLAPNLLKQDFTADRPNQKWVGDLTYIATDEGWLYLAGVEDLYHRKLIGWSFSSRMKKQLTIDAIHQAMGRERPQNGLIFHSDRGSQYAAYDYQDILRKHGIRQSMSAKGNCYDNASMESFFSTLKKDLIYGNKFKTRKEAIMVIVEYIETFYNCKRLHSSLGNMSPMEYEQLFKEKQAA